MANKTQRAVSGQIGTMNVRDHRPQDEPTFPQFLKFPFELQVNVWLEAFPDIGSKPSVHFFNIKVDYIKVEPKYHHTDGNRWYPSLRASAASADDSAPLVLEDIAALCPSAARALRISRGGRERSDAPICLVDTTTDLLCLQADRFLLSTLRWVPHDIIEPRDRYSYIETTRTKQAFGGFRKVGLAYGHTCQPKPMNWSWILGSGRNIAGLIDCFPDIREFCLVLCPHSAIKTDQGHRVVEWYDNHTVAQGCELYAGRVGRYHEMHRGEYGQPLCRKCRDPWDVLDETRAILLDETWSWRLSRERRREINFMVLLKDMPDVPDMPDNAARG